MNQSIFIVDRKTRNLEKEKVYGEFFIKLLYQHKALFSKILTPLLPFLSKIYAKFSKSKFSTRKIPHFIKIFNIDTNEFVKKVENFDSFNDFFCRKIKKRTFEKQENILIMPADGRYLVFPDLSKCEGIVVKGAKFAMEDFLQDAALAKKFEEGSMAICRLAPCDYHHFHFPCSATPKESNTINGNLFSVNPLALRQNIQIFCENKRMLTLLDSKKFGEIVFVEVGATFVGTIVQTFAPNVLHKKGEEKGYFSFGGSSIVMLFEKNKIVFDQDLVENSAKFLETKGCFGESLAKISK